MWQNNFGNSLRVASSCQTFNLTTHISAFGRFLPPFPSLLFWSSAPEVPPLCAVYMPPPSWPWSHLTPKCDPPPWTPVSRLRLCSSSASRGPAALRRRAAARRSHRMTRWPGSRASWPTSATGPPWPPSPHTSRWWDSRSPTSSRWATGRRAPAPGSPTCTWPAWRSRCRTCRWATPIPVLDFLVLFVLRREYVIFSLKFAPNYSCCCCFNWLLLCCL